MEVNNDIYENNNNNLNNIELIRLRIEEKKINLEQTKINLIKDNFEQFFLNLH